MAPILFARENVDAFYLEFDDERSGGFEPLAHVAPGKKVVLGLVTTKRPELEDRDAVIARIHEAARFVPLEDLCLSPQCGFASCEIGNKLTEDEQWAKIALVRGIAEEVWGGITKDSSATMAHDTPPQLRDSPLIEAAFSKRCDAHQKGNRDAWARSTRGVS